MSLHHIILIFIKYFADVSLQSERAFQRQPTVFLNKKRAVTATKSAKAPRYVRSVGLGFKTPREVGNSSRINM